MNFLITTGFVVTATGSVTKQCWYRFVISERSSNTSDEPQTTIGLLY